MSFFDRLAGFLLTLQLFTLFVDDLDLTFKFTDLCLL